MWKITFDSQKCEGDGDCVDACPVTILSLGEVDNKKTAILSGKEEDCLGCMACTTTCQNDAIAVLEA